MTSYCLLVLFLCCYAIEFADSYQCIDENGKPVDWFVAYKLPQLKFHSNERVRNGVGLMTFSANTKGTWRFSQYASNESTSLLGRTLQPLYQKKASQNIFWLLYNDQPPNATVSFDRGHTKGVVFGDSSSGRGVWLVHSVPHYPPPPENGYYGYPNTGRMFGQSFLCLSFEASQLDAVGQQLMFNDPNLYSSSIPSAASQRFPHLVAVSNNIRVRKAPFYNQLTFSTTGGASFVSFAKAGKFGKELYSDWVALSLKSALDVESWPNGRGRLPSSCKRPFQVYNVQLISFANITAGIKFTDHQDHSKWATSSSLGSNGNSWTCIGDINRMEEQKNRGGGTVCLQSSSLHSTFRTIVRQVEPCPKAKLKNFTKYHHLLKPRKGVNKQ